MDNKKSEKAEGLYALTYRLSYKHENAVVEQIRKNFRSLIKEKSPKEHLGKYVTIVSEAIIGQIKTDREKEFSDYSDEQLDFQAALIADLSENSTWKQTVVRAARIAESTSSNYEALSKISLCLSFGLCDVANQIYRDYGNIADVLRIRGGDADLRNVAIRAILTRAMENGGLQSEVDTLTSQEELVLYRSFFVLEEHSIFQDLDARGVDISQLDSMQAKDIFSLKLSAMEKIRSLQA